jgi:SAM-dependent methyltransferase
VPPEDADRRAEWEAKWARADFAPGWRTRSIPAEVREAVESGWFPAGEPVLDIGCGSGEIAAWLATQGYDVTGIDFAESAIARAKAAYGEPPGLRFEAVDICRDVPGDGRYGALLDRGCLHAIEPPLRPDYARNVAAVAKPGGRFLLFHVVRKNMTKDEVVRNVESLCRPAFDVVRVTDTVMSGGSGAADAHTAAPSAAPRDAALRSEARARRARAEGRAGVALWMVRSS